MADHSTPTGSNLYVDYTAKLKARHEDLLLQLDPAYTTPTNVPNNTVRFSSAAAKWQKWSGTSWTDLVTTYSISTTGNAATATSLATARTIGGVSFDGTTNINLPGVNLAGNQSTTGNAATATALATARTIGGVSFDGTTNINLPGVNTAGNQSTTGNAATATLAASATLAVALSTNRSTYKGVTDGNVVGQLMWKNYGNGHTIFDASAGTSPDGAAVNNTNPANSWSGNYPTLMGWNGTQTYGVRVDSARVADTTGSGGGGLTTNTANGSSALISNTTGYYNTANGSSALISNTTGYYNTANGTYALYTNTAGLYNTANGSGALYYNTTASYNTANGSRTLFNNTTGSFNTANGASALFSNTTGTDNTANGYNALYYNTTGTQNTANGTYALIRNTTGTHNTANGYNALYYNTAGTHNTANGTYALYYNTTGTYNTANGSSALISNTTGTQNTANGSSALYYNTTGSHNTANGYNALYNNTAGFYNTANGTYALYSNTTGYWNTANGYNALYYNTTFSNVTGLGRDSQVTGSNQVQLGDSNAVTYVYGTVQNRSDLRDKADIRDTTLGLNFINALRPVDYRWDMREDYTPERPESFSVAEPGLEATQQELAAFASAKAEHKRLVDKWLESVKHENLVHDGSKKRSRYHHGLIAQEVKAVIDSTGVDFGGFQDHKVTGGEDVLSIGYDELLAPLIKAVQELTARLAALEK